MRGLLAGLVIAVVVILVALLGALLGAFGIAAIGWLLHRAFDLTQWQGSLLALATAGGLGYLVFRLAIPPITSSPLSSEWEPWEDESEEAASASARSEAVEPPIVAWRRNRPTPGELPEPKSAARESRKPFEKG